MKQDFFLWEKMGERKSCTPERLIVQFKTNVGLEYLNKEKLKASQVAHHSLALFFWSALDQQGENQHNIKLTTNYF